MVGTRNLDDSVQEEFAGDNNTTRNENQKTEDNMAHFLNLMSQPQINSMSVHVLLGISATDAERQPSSGIRRYHPSWRALSTVMWE